MVSLWPWRADSSTASFEKTLSTLSVKITKTQTRLDKLRASSRRVKVLTTLYLTFAYLVYSIVIFLVIGTKDLGQWEWAGLIAGPFFMYGTRKSLTAIYNYRIDNLASRLQDQQAERAKTIQKLKDATKYDSTMELIEKYGGVDGRPKSQGRESGEVAVTGESKGRQGRHSDIGVGPNPSRRTTMPPPPTANIQRRASASPATPHVEPSHDAMEPTAEFAPNAEDTLSPERPISRGQQAPPEPVFAAYPTPSSEPHWYDRIFDVLLGEDEMAPKNRIALICQTCRLVNGQAPPGTRSLGELGEWRCMSCGASNGTPKEDEGKRIVREVLSSGTAERSDADASDESEDEPEQQDMEEASGTAVDDGPAASVRKRRGRNKK